MADRVSKDYELPIWLFLALPVLVILLPFVLLAVTGDRSFYDSWVESEAGLVENATVVLAVLALLLALRAVVRRARFPVPWLGYWMLLLALGCLYIAGEEASWGQQWFHWESPDVFKRLNEQQETNLHNLSKPLDRIPNFIAGLGVILGGIVWPIARRRWRIAFAGSTDWRSWFFPTDVVIPAAVLKLLVTIAGRLQVWTGLHRDPVWGFKLNEVSELTIVFFIFMYVASIDRRLAQV